MLSRTEQVQFLVEIGFMPSTAERLVQDDADADSQIIGTRKAANLATVTPADAETAAQWWYYSPDVPLAIKRMLDATPITT